MRIGWFWLIDDVARLHVEIDKLNDLLVGFCFIRSIDIDYQEASNCMHVDSIMSL
jgi:hypothetical protein